MFRLKDTQHQNTAEFLSSAINIAEYYGFSSLEEVGKLPQIKAVDAVGAPGKQIEKRKIPSAAECESEMTFARRDARARRSGETLRIVFARYRFSPALETIFRSITRKIQCPIGRFGIACSRFIGRSE